MIKRYIIVTSYFPPEIDHTVYFLAALRKIHYSSHKKMVSQYMII